MPAHLDPFSRAYEGWVAPQQLVGTNNATSIPQIETSGTVYQLLANPGGIDWTFKDASGTGEYFLIENRQKTGYDAALKGCGLLIWHIDETGRSSNSANADETRKLVDLEEADGLNHLDNTTNRSDAGDPYPGTSLNPTFDHTSNPNSELYGGALSGVGVTNISTMCSSSMSADIDTPTTGPPNDAFANAILLSSPRASRTGDSNVGATKETGEPNHAENIGGKSVWYGWTAEFAGKVTIQTAGSNFDTLLSVYTGSSVESMSLVASNDDVGNGDLTSRVAFDAVAGTMYRIVVDGFNGGGGAASGSINLGLEQINDDFAAATVVSGTSVTRTGDTNVGATKQDGEPIHAGNAGGASIWYRWVPTGSGQVTIDTFGSNFDTLLAVYTGSSLGSLTSVASNDDTGGLQSQVSFAAAAGTIYQIAVDGFNGGTGALTGSVNLHLTQSVPPPPRPPPPTSTATVAPISCGATPPRAGTTCGS